MKHILQIAAIALLATALISCNKEEENNTNTNTTPQDTTQTTTQKHNVELVYGQALAQWQNISIDTLQKYNNDKEVDTIFMIPENYNQYSTVSTNALKNIASELRERHNVNPDKVFGKGELLLLGSSVENNPEIVRFFEDTLRYHVTYYGQAK